MINEIKQLYFNEFKTGSISLNSLAIKINNIIFNIKDNAQTEKSLNDIIEIFEKVIINDFFKNTVKYEYIENFILEIFNNKLIQVYDNACIEYKVKKDWMKKNET